MKPIEALESTTFRGRRFTRKQLEQVQETVHSFQNLSRKELSQTICENLNWKTPKGTNKTYSGLALLEKLEALGVITLPAKRHTRIPVQHPTPHKEAEALVDGNLTAIEPIVLKLVTTNEDRTLWKSYIQSYHYLGYKRPIGSHLCYFVVSEARQQNVGCVLFSAAAAWRLAPRDKWIGWDKKQREKFLHLVLSQNRFLIFPWVKVPNLGSKILSLSTKQVGNDWVSVHGYRPVLIETFVDPTRFSGTSYRAANWHYLGETQGRGDDPEHKNNKTRKAIFVYPLQSDWRQCLTEGCRSRTLKKRYRNDVLASSKQTVGDNFVNLWEKVIHIIHETANEYDDKWRIRRRVLNSKLLMLLIFRLVSSRNSKSYGTAIDDLWDSCDKLKITLPQENSIAPSSFCAARKKLDASVFKCVNQRIISEYAQEAGRYKWLGHRLFAIDGSRINLPRELTAYGYKTLSKNMYYPEGLLSCLYQIKSQLPFDFSLTPHLDERLCATQHLNILRPHDVVVYDRGYFSYMLLRQHCQMGIHAIFRLQDYSCNVIREFSESSQTDVVVDIAPSRKRNIQQRYPDYSNLNPVPFKMRLIKYEIGGNVYRLGTTLLDDKRWPLRDLMDVYHARWGIEELYKISKQYFVIEDFHAKSERGVKQEIYAHFVLITMNRLFANQSDINLNGNDSASLPTQRLQTVNPTVPNMVLPRIQTNFKNCIHAVVQSLEELLMIHDHIATVVHRVFNLIVRRYQRVRPGRSYQRKSMKPNAKWQPTKKKESKKVEIAHAVA
ncbi:MAG: IS4 family transposase [Patescibacteria group bacterium]